MRLTPNFYRHCPLLCLLCKAAYELHYGRYERGTVRRYAADAKMFLFSRASRPSLEHSWPRIQRVVGFLSRQNGRRVKSTTHLHLVSMRRKAINPGSDVPLCFTQEKIYFCVKGINIDLSLSSHHPREMLVTTS